MSRTVKCPSCARAVEWSAAEPNRPFCSERCRLIDLGEWATGAYAVPAPLTEDDELDGIMDEDGGLGP